MNVHTIFLILDEAQEAEAVQVLNAVLDIRDHTPSSINELIKIYHALAMLQFLFKNLSAVSASCLLTRIDHLAIASDQRDGK